MTFLVSVNKFMTRDDFRDCFSSQELFHHSVEGSHGQLFAAGSLWRLLAHILADQEEED